MKSAEHRDDMVARVQTAHSEYPTFDSLPLRGKRTNDKSRVITWPLDEARGEGAYVAALYELCFRGGVPIGRIDAKGDEPAQIIGEVVAESAEADYGGGALSVHAEKE